jgi:murein L,D-transpeptidase YafK
MRRTGALLILLLPLLNGGLQASGFPTVDRVVVDKSDRKLHLIMDGEPYRTFDIALGIRPVGDKEYEGDFRTPEGTYRLDARNPNSEFFLSIHVSYPNGQDIREARAMGVDPGGAIMIHGLPNNPTRSEAYYRTQDWTNGCIAVSNSDMIDIWLMTADNTPIEIRP